MPPSELVKEFDGIQRQLKNSPKEHGFKLRGRIFDRVTDDGLTQVINLQMGAADPPGTTYIPGLRENLYGLFTVNLGIYIPEVAELHGGGAAKSWVQAYHCSIRDRLGHASGSPKDMWWPVRASREAIHHIQLLLLSFGLVFLERFGNRDLVLSELDGHGENLADELQLSSAERGAIRESVLRNPPNANGYDIEFSNPVGVIAEVKCNIPINGGAVYGSAQRDGIIRDIAALMTGKSKSRMDPAKCLKFLVLLDTPKIRSATQQLVRTLKQYRDAIALVEVGVRPDSVEKLHVAHVAAA